MLNLDQVKLLESKVEKAVQMIKSLNTEKDALKKEIEAKDKRISDLEKLIAAFKDDQSKIEEGIINALNQLSAFEDASYTAKTEAVAEAQHIEEPPIETPPEISIPVQVPASEPLPEKTAEPQKAEDSTSEKQIEPKTVSNEEPISDNLQKDLDDVLGQSSDTSKQMDIF